MKPICPICEGNLIFKQSRDEVMKLYYYYECLMCNRQFDGGIQAEPKIGEK